MILKTFTKMLDHKLNKDINFLWLIPFNTNPLFSSSLDILDPMEREKGSSFRDPNNQTKYFYYHIALRKILSQYNSKLPSEIEYSFNSQNKPFIKDSNMHFSFSHSSEIAICGITSSHSIGIDIEKIISIDFQSIISTFFSLEEIQAISSLEEKDKTIGFYSIWTAKEAYGKARGVGITYPLTRITIPIYHSNNRRVVVRGIDDDIWVLWRFLYQDHTGKYIVSFITPNLKSSIQTFSYENNKAYQWNR